MRAIVPGNVEASELWKRIVSPHEDEVMPPPDAHKAPLTATQRAIIKRWIEEGAKDDTPPDTTPPIDADHPPVYSGPPVITSLDWSPNGELLAVAGFHEVLLQKADGSGLVARLVVRGGQRRRGNRAETGRNSLDQRLDLARRAAQSIRRRSPSRSSASGPPTAASGAT